MKDITLLTKEEIQGQVKKLALDIIKYYEEQKIENLCVIWIAEGAIFFAVDLLRNLENIECDIMSIKASSYGMNTYSSGNVQIEGNLEGVARKDVLLIDDILETGLTLKTIVAKLESLGAKSCKTCVLLDKNKPEASLKADFKCFDIEDKFVFGYGLDINKNKRNSQDIFYKG